MIFKEYKASRLATTLTLVSIAPREVAEKAARLGHSWQVKSKQTGIGQIKVTSGFRRTRKANLEDVRRKKERNKRKKETI